jgi:hypothetical protein
VVAAAEVLAAHMLVLLAAQVAAQEITVVALMLGVLVHPVKGLLAVVVIQLHIKKPVVVVVVREQLGHRAFRVLVEQVETVEVAFNIAYQDQQDIMQAAAVVDQDTAVEQLGELVDQAVEEMALKMQQVRLELELLIEVAAVAVEHTMLLITQVLRVVLE